MSEHAPRAPSVLFVVGRSVPRDDTLCAAVALTARVSGELHAVFIEEEDVLRAAALPFGSRLAAGPWVAEPLQVASVVREWRALSDRVRQVIEREAQRLRVKLEYRVARSSRLSELEGAYAGGDLVMLAGVHPPNGGAVGRTEAPTLGRKSVKILYDGSADAERALEVAQLLAGPSQAIEIWVVSPDLDRAHQLHESLRARLGSAPRIRALDASETTRSAALGALHAVGRGILVLPERAGLAPFVTALSREMALPCWAVLTR